MKLDNIPEQELLELPKKTEEEQAKWLSDKYILKSSPVYLRPTFTGLGDRDGVCEETLAGDTTWNQRLESLADLAERLWKKAREIKLCEGGDLLTALCDVAGVMENRKKCTQCGHESSAGSVFFWATDADAIHRIVAALIALQRAGVEI
jgi:hypothetical protein